MAMTSEEPQVGDQVSWPYGGSHPTGEVAEKKTEGELSIQSKKGNTITRKAGSEDPAVHVSRSGNDVVKNQSELTIEEKKEGGDMAEDSETAEGANGGEMHGEAKSGEKHARDEDDEEPEKEVKKARGRPKKDAGSAAPTPAKKTPAPKPKRGFQKKEPAEKIAAPAKKEPVPNKESAPKKVAAAKKAAPEPAADSEPKKGRGRPKKDGSASTPAVKKAKKSKGVANGTGVGSRTRSKN